MQKFLSRRGAAGGRGAGLGRATAILAMGLLWAAPALRAATESEPMTVVPKWGRFELLLKSDVLYSNALQDATLTVLFTSPLGETNLVYGFWDGANDWRVRFSPNQPGRWRYKTTCSDTPNRGLHNRSGDFLCTAELGRSPFHIHGQVQVARDHHHLEYADGKPFFWLADTTWKGMPAAEPDDWEFYGLVRAARGFTVVQWAVRPGQNSLSQTAVAGFPDRIAVNPAFFQELDNKVDLLTQAGLLSAIAPSIELTARQRESALSDDQTALLVRYCVARWGSEPVVWLLAFDGSVPGLANRWKRIGHAVFEEVRHAPVMIFPGQALEALEGFRNQNWVDLLGGEPITDFTDAALERAFNSAFFKEWSNTPCRPVIPTLPCENGLRPHSKQRFSAEEVRKAAYWSLLLSSPAGLTYAAHGVVEWDPTLPAQKSPVPGGNLPLWRRATFMPGAKQMVLLASKAGDLDFWRLRPVAKGLAEPAGNVAPHKFIALAATESKDLALVYDPEERTFRLGAEVLPPAPQASWFDPRTGSTSAARPGPFTTPQAGDWLLILKGGKR